jgi:hypothetical protein
MVCPLGVKLGRSAMLAQCPLDPPKADTKRSGSHIRLAPKATYAAQQRPLLFDHLVGAEQRRSRHLEA